MSEKPELRTMEPEDLFRLRFLQGARLSPDGRNVVYAVSHVAEEDARPDEDGQEELEEKEYVTLWLLSLETGEARPLTAGLARDSTPRWSPDGKVIAFLSSRGDKPQIYLLPVDGGEARALTALSQGVGSGPEWSPDGEFIAFTAGPPKKPLSLDKPYRVTRHTYRFDHMGPVDNAVQDLYLIPAGGGQPRPLTHDNWLDTMPRWSPDGREIIFVAMMAPDTHAAHLGRLRAVGLEGKTREITGGWGEVLSAAWALGGERIAFIGKPHGRPIGSKLDLWVVGREGGEPECRTSGLEFGVGGGLQSDMAALLESLAPDLLVTPDGLTACVGVQEGGTVAIYRVALSGPESWAPVVGGERSCTPLDLDEKHLLFAVSTLHSPPDLLMVTPAGADERRLTHLNTGQLAGIARPAAVQLLFPAADGVQVEGWLLRPPVGDPPYPTVLYIHGGPHSGFGHCFSFDFQLLAGAGYAVLFINQRGSTGYGDGFANRILGDWGNLDYTDLMAGVDFAIEGGLADPQRLGCCGLSGGGNLSCWIVGQTDRFKAAVPENPVTNWTSFYGTSDLGAWFAAEELGGPPHQIPEVYRRCSPITYAHRCKTPTLLIQGESDLRCPAEQSEQFYTVLKANGCVVEMLRLPHSDHVESMWGKPIVRRAQNRALLDWMNQYVLGIEPGDQTPTTGP
jgi:dipeptidyl aminopeptidase/acylaminoacyl peptidase